MPTPDSIQGIYLLLLFGNTLAASFIWGINTIFLLDAGLSNLEAFSANAFFTAGMVVFEVPTGVIADTVGRRVSYLLGTATLMVTTLAYLLLWHIKGPFWLWAVVSALLGLGFTFFSGAVEAWLVDALHATGFKGDLESVFARGQIASGVAMLSGSVAGGYLAQTIDLGLPYVLRTSVLGVMFLVAFMKMRDIGFSPGRREGLLPEMQKILSASFQYGWRIPAVRWTMIAAPFDGGVLIYGFYALQPYLLELYGNSEAYGIAGLAAAIVAGAQILGGLVAPRLRTLFKRRTSALLAGTGGSAVALALVGLIGGFWVVLVLVAVWGLLYAALSPIRHAYLNALIPSRERATILSLDSLMGSSGGVVIQPVLGRSADVWGYGISYVLGAGISALALPFIILARRQNVQADVAAEAPVIAKRAP